MNRSHHFANGALVTGAIAGLQSPEQILVGAVLGACGALLPDMDIHIGTHRKTGHNFFLLGAIALLSLLSPPMIYVAIGVASHFAVDLLSRRGMAFFYPISAEEYPKHGGVTVDDERSRFLTGVMSVFEIGIVALFL